MISSIYSTANAAYFDVAQALLDSSRAVVDSRNGPMREILGCSFSISQPGTIASMRRFSSVYAAGELLWYLSWDNRGDQILHYAPRYQNYLEYDGSGVMRAKGGYGLRLRWQMSKLMDHLANEGNENSRQAVVIIYDEQDVNRVTRDCPCTLSLQFLKRDGFLHLIVTMRSNDVWLGLPYDLFCFSRIQILIAQSLGLQVGVYHHQVGSMHVYEEDVPKLWKRIDEPYQQFADLTHYYRPITNFLTACQVATKIEQQSREEGWSVARVESEVDKSSQLQDTMLGAMCTLAAVQHNPGKKPRNVDASLMEILK